MGGSGGPAPPCLGSHCPPAGPVGEQRALLPLPPHVSLSTAQASWCSEGVRGGWYRRQFPPVKSRELGAAVETGLPRRVPVPSVSGAFPCPYRARNIGGPSCCPCGGFSPGVPSLHSQPLTSAPWPHPWLPRGPPTCLCPPSGSGQREPLLALCTPCSEHCTPRASLSSPSCGPAPCPGPAPSVPLTAARVKPQPLALGQ